jgi:hypothetical protein
MKVYLSSLCSRKKLQFIFKIILIVVVVNFLGYVFILNFNNNQTNNTNGHNVNLFGDKQHDYEKKKFEDFVKMQKTIKKENEANLNVDDEEKDDDENADEDKKYIDDSKDVPTQVLQRRKRFYAIDGNGMASVNTEIVKCDDRDPLEVEVISSSSSMASKADFSYFLNSAHVNPNLNSNSNNNNNNGHFHYNMVYAMESEPHSNGGETWSNADFRMWYNLDASFPEPATYFDVRGFLPDLLAPPRVEYEQKEQGAHLAWILSNCHAFNGREAFVEKLMKKIGVDSYGGCLRNKNTHTSSRMTGK